jgi:hypothetical protein
VSKARIWVEFGGVRACLRSRTLSEGIHTYRGQSGDEQIWCRYEIHRINLVTPRNRSWLARPAVTDREFDARNLPFHQSSHVGFSLSLPAIPWAPFLHGMVGYQCTWSMPYDFICRVEHERDGEATLAPPRINVMTSAQGFCPQLTESCARKI